MNELGYECREIRVVTLICNLQVPHCKVLNLFSTFSESKSYCWKFFLIKGDFSNSYFISKKGTSTFEVFLRTHVRFFTKSPWFFLSKRHWVEFKRNAKYGQFELLISHACNVHFLHFYE